MSGKTTIVEGCLGIGLGLLVIVPVMIVSAVINGFVLVQLWDWFVATTFGAPALSIPAAIGLSLIVGHFRRADWTKDEQKTAPLWVRWAFEFFIAPGLVLLVGRIVYGFM